MLAYVRMLRQTAAVGDHVAGRSSFNGETDLGSIAAVNQNIQPQAQQGVQLTAAGIHKQDRGVSAHQVA